MQSAHAPEEASMRSPRGRYRPPTSISETKLSEVLIAVGRPLLEPRQMNLLRSKGASESGDLPLYYAGDVTILQKPCVSIVGTREASPEGYARATRLARELVHSGCAVVSGLARGIDTAAHTSAIKAGGRTVAVIGTPLTKAYPAENAELQAEIYRDHLLLTPFASGEAVFKGNFPKRNRVMAAISDATVIVEASDTSGTLHQAVESGRLNRWLFIMRSVVEDASLRWPARFLGDRNVRVLADTTDIIEAIKATP